MTDPRELGPGLSPGGGELVLPGRGNIKVSGIDLEQFRQEPRVADPYGQLFLAHVEKQLGPNATPENTQSLFEALGLRFNFAEGRAFDALFYGISQHAGEATSDTVFSLSLADFWTAYGATPNARGVIEGKKREEALAAWHAMATENRRILKKETIPGRPGSKPKIRAHELEFRLTNVLETIYEGSESELTPKAGGSLADSPKARKRLKGWRFQVSPIVLESFKTFHAFRPLDLNQKLAAYFEGRKSKASIWKAAKWLAWIDKTPFNISWHALGYKLDLGYLVDRKAKAQVIREIREALEACKDPRIGSLEGYEEYEGKEGLSFKLHLRAHSPSRLAAKAKRQGKQNPEPKGSEL